MKVLVGALVAAVFLACVSSSANAGTVQLVNNSSASTSNLGSFTGSMSYDGLDTLIVTLKNTTIAGGGYITGFVFNTSGSASALLTPNPTGAFWNLATAGDLSGSPFGTFEAGAALGEDFLGGGSPNRGLAVGDTEAFTFRITGGAGLEVEDFFVNTNQTSQPFVVRFRGIAIGDGSDKVPAQLVVPPTVAVPLPPAAWSGLGMLALMGGVGVVRRLRHWAPRAC